MELRYIGWFCDCCGEYYKDVDEDSKGNPPVCVVCEADE